MQSEKQFEIRGAFGWDAFSSEKRIATKGAMKC
jgi:hypothetical protein